MNRMLNITKPVPAVVCLCLAFNVLFTIVLGSYFEAYEGIFSSMVSGMYTERASQEWFNDVHFLLLPLYAHIQGYFPEAPVYGMVLLIFANAGLLLTGMALYKILGKIKPPYALLIFAALYVFISVESLLHLSTNRIAFYLFAGVCWNLGLLQEEGQERKYLPVAGLWFLMILAALMRYEVVLICSGVYIAVKFFLKRLQPRDLLPLLISLAVLGAFNFCLSEYATEAKKVFIIRELQFIDRNDVAYDKLPQHWKREVDAVRQYSVMDAVHFTGNFYDSVSAAGRVAVSSRLDGVNIHSFASIFSTSVVHILKIWFVLAAVILLLAVLFVKDKTRRFRWPLLIMLLLLPPAMCLYELVPPRIVVPYYSILTILLIAYVLNRFPQFNKMILLIAVFLMLFALRNVRMDRFRYKDLDKIYITTREKIDKLCPDNTRQCDLYFNNIQLEKFFPVKALNRNPSQRVPFINFYYFASYGCYTAYWESLGVKNPFSLEEKIKYVMGKNGKLVSTPETMEFTTRYLKDKYGTKIYPAASGKLDSELNIYSLSGQASPR